MKLHKLISRTVLATALLGITIGGAFAGINVNASSSADTDYSTTGAGNVQGNSGNPDTTDTSRLSIQGSPSSRKSEVGANMKDGFLTLDSVPNLGFGNNISTSTGQDSTLNLNNGNNGVLKVTDNRNIDKQNTSDKPGNTNGSGWNLSAQLDSIKFNGTTINNPDTWTMKFNNLNIQTNSTNPGYTTPNVVSNSNSNNLTTSNNDGSSTQIINASGSNTGYGTQTINFNNRPDYASLSVPNVQNGSYTTTMHWNLNSNLGSYNTGYGS